MSIFNKKGKDNWSYTKDGDRTYYSFPAIPNNKLGFSSYNINTKYEGIKTTLIDLDKKELFWFFEYLKPLEVLSIDILINNSFMGNNYFNRYLMSQYWNFVVQNKKLIDKIQGDNVSIGGYTGGLFMKMNLSSPYSYIEDLVLKFNEYGGEKGHVTFIKRDDFKYVSNSRVFVRKFNKQFFSGFAQLEPEYDNETSKVTKINLIGGFEKIKSVKIEYPSFQIISINNLDKNQGTEILSGESFTINLIYNGNTINFKEKTFTDFFDNNNNFDFFLFDKDDDMFENEKVPINEVGKTEGLIYRKFFDYLKNKSWFEFSGRKIITGGISLTYTIKRNLVSILGESKLDANDIIYTKFKDINIKRIKLKFNPYFYKKTYKNKDNEDVDNKIENVLKKTGTIFMKSVSFNDTYKDISYQFNTNTTDFPKGGTDIKIPTNLFYDNYTIKDFIDNLKLITGNQVYIGVNPDNAFFLKLKNGLNISPEDYTFDQNIYEGDFSIYNDSKYLCNSVNVLSKNDTNKKGSLQSGFYNNKESIKKYGLYEKKIQLNNIYDKDFSQQIAKKYVEEFSEPLTKIKIKHVKTKRDYILDVYKFKTVFKHFNKNFLIFTDDSKNQIIEESNYNSLTDEQKSKYFIVVDDGSKKDYETSSEQLFSKDRTLSVNIPQSTKRTIKFYQYNFTCLKVKFLYINVWCNKVNISIDVKITAEKNDLFSSSSSSSSSSTFLNDDKNKWKTLKIDLTKNDFNYISNIEMTINNPHTNDDLKMYISEIDLLCREPSIHKIPLSNKVYYYKNHNEYFDLTFFNKDDQGKSVAESLLERISSNEEYINEVINEKGGD